MKSETRCLSSAELRFDESSNKIVGYAIVYDSLSVDLGGFREIIRPGALTNVLKSPDLDVRALINHDKNLILGRSTAGTLRLVDGQRGLYVEIDPPDVQYARDLRENMKVGNITGMSFRFYMSADGKGQKWTRQPEGFAQREITEFASIDDVSVVTYPAYTDSTAAVRSFEEYEKSLMGTPARDRAERLLNLIALS